MTIYRWESGAARIDIDDETSEYKFFLEDEPALTDADMLTIFEVLLEDCYVDGSLFEPVAEETEPKKTLSAEEFRKLMIADWPPPVVEPPRGMASAEAVSSALEMQQRRPAESGEGYVYYSQDVLKYRCQYCGKVTPAADWMKNGEACPKCGRAYSWMDAQDVEDAP